MVLRPNDRTPPTAEVYAEGVPGSNGVAWDERGELWVSDGGTGQGRVWRIGRDRVPVEAFRVQPMASDALPGGVGRDVRGLPPGTITITETSRAASNTLGSQAIVANGLAFGRDGTLFIADTARGAIWRVFIDRRGRILSRTGCDTTFAANTLCLDNVLVQHPYLDGADGIVLDDDEQHLRRRERAQRDRGRDREGPSGGALPQPGRRRPAAQHRPARVPDQPGAGGQAAVHHELRHRAA